MVLISGRAWPSGPGSRHPVLGTTLTPAVMSVPEFVMYRFEPLITQRPPCNTAVVCTPRSVAAGAFLGKAERPQPLPADTGSQEALFLLGRAVRGDRRTAEGDMRLHRDSHGRVCTADLF